MDKVSEDVRTVEVKEEFRVCAACGYERGFHVSFVPEDEGGRLRLGLICLNCGQRYEIGKFM